MSLLCQAVVYQVSADKRQLLGVTMPDEAIQESRNKCDNCTKDFGAFRKRYACNFCGTVCCDECAPVLPLRGVSIQRGGRSYDLTELRACNWGGVPGRTTCAAFAARAQYCVHDDE